MSLRSRRFLRPACEQCGSAEKLEVHHIDRNHKNDEPSNLKTLCRQCHHNHHYGNIRLTARLTFSVTDPDLLREVDEWRSRRPALPNRAEAIRRLVNIALQQQGTEERP